MNTIAIRPKALALLAALALGACGGNDDGPYPPAAAADPTQVPASATASPAAFSNYLAALPPSETADPLVVSGLMPPTSESDDPVAVR